MILSLCRNCSLKESRSAVDCQIAPAKPLTPGRHHHPAKMEHSMAGLGQAEAFLLGMQLFKACNKECIGKNAQKLDVNSSSRFSSLQIY